MNRLPWAPLNAGVFLIILGASVLLHLVGVLNFLTQGLPVVFLIFGLWLIFAGLVLPQTSQYGAPRTMVLGWGGLIAVLGGLWLAGATSGALLAVAFAVLIIVAGVGAVGYSLMRANSKTSSPPPA